MGRIVGHEPDFDRIPEEVMCGLYPSRRCIVAPATGALCIGICQRVGRPVAPPKREDDYPHATIVN